MLDGASINAPTDVSIASDGNVIHRLRISSSYKHYRSYNMCTEVAPISHSDRNDRIHVERLRVDADVSRDGRWVCQMGEA